MNLLSVIHYPVFGGPHNQILRLGGALAQRGWDTVALLPNEPGNAAERLRAAGLEVITMPLHRLRASPDPRVQLAFLLGSWWEVQQIRAIIRRRQIDLVQVNGLVNPHAALAAYLEGVPVVWQLLDTRPSMALRRLLMPLVTGLADVVMSTGLGVADVHPGAAALGERLVPFFPPVDTRVFRPDPERRAQARRELGVPEGAYLIGTVANLTPQKGLEYLIRAVTLLNRDCEPRVYVRILGAAMPSQSEYGQSIRRLADKLGWLADGRLQFMDPGSRVGELVLGLDVFLLTSVPRSEGVPTVILEAMACGVPVVATDVGAVREVVEDGVTGYVVAPLVVKQIGAATAQLLANGELRARTGRVARERAVARYGVEACAATHLHAYELALAHHDKEDARRVAGALRRSISDR